MPHVYAAASTPLGQAALELASEGPRTKGGKAVFAVVLMFTILCGGVFMLLQSSFGPKVGYLITGTAFWGCWLVLGVIWLFGVPSVPMPFGIPDVPRSSARYTGPQGTDSSWEMVDTDEEKQEHPVSEDALVTIDKNSPIDQGLIAQVTAAETAAGEGIAAYYAKALSTEASRIQPNTVYLIDTSSAVLDGGRVKLVRFTTKPAVANASTSEETKALLAKVQPATFDLYFLEGDLATPTYLALGLFVLLFGVHVVLLGLADTSRAPVPEGVPERLVNA